MKNIFSSTTLTSQAFAIICILATIAGIYVYGFGLQEFLILTLGYFIYGSLGIVVTFHRYLTHKSYETYPWLVKLFSIFGCVGGTGSTIAWVAIHINHHLKSDKIDDPHSPRHKGLRVFNLDYEKGIDPNTRWRIRHLITDPFHQFLHKYYMLIIIGWGLAVYLIGGVYGLIWFHLAPAAFGSFMSNIVNYMGHRPKMPGGFRRYNLNDDSTNNWLWAIPSWGETWHNNHHRHPKNFSCGEKWWEIDISAYIIRLIKTN